jgi:hypothetical protein
MKPTTLSLIRRGAVKKGDALSVARIAGISAAKRTAELIPLCHPIATTKIEIDFEFAGKGGWTSRRASKRSTGPASKWRRWRRRPSRPSPSTTCARRLTGGWKLIASASSKSRAAGPAGMFVPAADR